MFSSHGDAHRSPPAVMSQREKPFTLTTFLIHAKVVLEPGGIADHVSRKAMTASASITAPFCLSYMRELGTCRSSRL
jgi:hypothetical protein